MLSSDNMNTQTSPASEQAGKIKSAYAKKPKKKQNKQEQILLRSINLSRFFTSCANLQI